MAVPEIFLASQSPRRRELLTRAGIGFELCEPGDEYVGAAHEHASERGDPRQLATERAQRKAEGAQPPLAGVPVLAVDTVVDVGGVELGKASDVDGARRMLQQLADRQHQVHTAHCLWVPGRTFVELATSTVICRAPTHGELERYLASEQWRGKAGAYGIQDEEQQFLTLHGGSFDTVVGLHVAAVRRLLEQAREGR